MVGIDGSEIAKASFYTALYMMNPERDFLFMIHVVHRTHMETIKMNQEHFREEGRELINQYGHLANTQKVRNAGILAISNNVGEMIIEQVKDKKIDFLVIGRRGISKLKRIFVGSTSRYCVEHAPCNVIVVKGDWAADEEHASKQEVINEEERERQRRISEKKLNEVQEKYHSDLARSISRMAEETERMARIEDEEALLEKEAIERLTVLHTGAVRLEEEERQRRIKGVSIDDRVPHVEIERDF